MMRFIDWFAGCGGMRLGLELAGLKCIGFCEIDKYARQAYKQMFDTKGEWEAHDVRTATNIPNADLWCFGFPCQDVSLAGKQRGLTKGKRSGLFFRMVELAKEHKPEWLLIENVKGLLSIGKGFDFARVVTALAELGYSLEWQVLNSKDFGVPQNRERVFIVGHFGNTGGRKVFPLTSDDGKNPAKCKVLNKGASRGYRLYDTKALSVTLASSTGGGGAKTGLYMVSDNAYSCVRRLTPRECFRLQGFPDEYFDRIQGISDTQLYKMAGNAVTVTVAKAIGERLYARP